jgi:hypothetical protein
MIQDTKFFKNLQREIFALSNEKHDWGKAYYNNLSGFVESF